MGIPWPQSHGVAAGVRQGCMDLSAVVAATRFAQGLAACLIGCECGEMIIGGPAGELGPFDRLELAAHQFQRAFGRCDVGGGKDNSAAEASDHAPPPNLRKTPPPLPAKKSISEGDGFGGPPKA